MIPVELVIALALLNTPTGSAVAAARMAEIREQTR